MIASDGPAPRWGSGRPALPGWTGYRYAALIWAGVWAEPQASGARSCFTAIEGQNSPQRGQANWLNLRHCITAVNKHLANMLRQVA